MEWDSKTPSSIAISRLRHLPPAEVYRELKEIASTQEDSWLGGDSEIEKALLERKDPLISLGLAQHCSSHDVGTVLYRQGLSKSGDATYDKALRMAVLGNPHLP